MAPGVHVASCLLRDAAYPDNILIIHASSGAAKVISQAGTITGWMGDGYSLRRLVAH